MSEPIPEFVSGRVYDELLGKYEFNLKQLEAAKAQFEAMNKNFSYMSDKFQEAFSMLEAEKAKSAKRRRLASAILCELTSYSQGRYIEGKEIEIKHEFDYEFYPNHVDKETILEFKKALLETDVEAPEAEAQCICGEINARHCPVHNEVQG